MNAWLAQHLRQACCPGQAPNGRSVRRGCLHQLETILFVLLGDALVKQDLVGLLVHYLQGAHDASNFPMDVVGIGERHAVNREAVALVVLQNALAQPLVEAEPRHLVAIFTAFGQIDPHDVVVVAVAQQVGVVFREHVIGLCYVALNVCCRRIADSAKRFEKWHISRLPDLCVSCVQRR